MFSWRKPRVDDTIGKEIKSVSQRELLFPVVFVQCFQIS